MFNVTDLVAPCVAAGLTLMAMIHTHITTKRREQTDLICNLLVPMLACLINDGAIRGFVIENGEEKSISPLELVNTTLLKMKKEYQA